MVNLAQALHDAERRLLAAGVDNPSLDAKLLIGYALGLNRTQIFAQAHETLSEDNIQKIENVIERRMGREPVARILGEREFWGLPFYLNEATLEPRPDSETLIEATIKALPTKQNAYRILDIGTGTGCLLLSLLQELPNATGLGLDIAPRAVEQAQENAARLNLNNRAVFKTNNWTEGIDESFDIVISNPPYIAHSDIATLMPDVQNFDPHKALDGGKDGLDPYRLLIPQLPRLLKPQGLAVFEVGQGQADDVLRIFENHGYTHIQTRNDLNNITRCVIASQSHL